MYYDLLPVSRNKVRRQIEHLKRTCSMLFLDFSKDLGISRRRGETHFALKRFFPRKQESSYRYICVIVCQPAPRSRSHSWPIGLLKIFTWFDSTQKTKEYYLASSGAVLWIRLHGWSLVYSFFVVFTLIAINIGYYNGSYRCSVDRCEIWERYKRKSSYPRC